VYGTNSGLCPLEDFIISSVEPLDSATMGLICYNLVSLGECTRVYPKVFRLSRY
jgi:hypothetical protein